MSEKLMQSQSCDGNTKNDRLIQNDGIDRQIKATLIGDCQSVLNM